MRKKVCQNKKAKTRTVSIPGDLELPIALRLSALDMGFSRYIQTLVRLDTDRRLLSAVATVHN